MSRPAPAPDAYRNVVGLRAVRNFRPESLAAGDLDAILEAARWTGSSKNTQPWAFVVCADADSRAALASAGRYAVAIENAPVAVAIVKLPRGGDFDIGRVAQNMMLAAAGRGVGSCPVTLHHEDRAREVLALPQGHACRYAVAFGYPDEAAEAAERRARSARGVGGRRPLEDMVHRGRFGR